MKNLTTKLFAIASVFCALTLTSCMDLYDGYETALIGNITLYGNGGTTVSGETSITWSFEKGKTVITLHNDNRFTEHDPGVQLSGWATTASAIEPMYGVGATIVPKYDTVLYAVWSATGLYVKNQSSGGNDGSDGTSEGKALRTIGEAIKRINAKHDPNAEWTVTVIGSLDPQDTTIESILAKKVIIQGTSNGTITGTGDSSVITIKGSEDEVLEFKNITITGGYKNVTDWVASNKIGGGIYIENTKAVVTLNEGTVITDNYAAMGGGIYNSGTLVIKGIATNKAKISLNSAKGLKTGNFKNGYGGGIYNNNGKLTFEGTNYLVTQNTANKSAGALYNYPDAGTSKLTPSITELASNTTNFTNNGDDPIEYGPEHP